MTPQIITLLTVIASIAATIVALMAITLIVSWAYNKNGLVEFTKDSWFYKLRYASNWIKAWHKVEWSDISWETLTNWAKWRTEQPITLCGAF